MGEYIDIIINAYKGYANYLWTEITFQYDYKPLWKNYFWLLVIVSLVFFGLELLKPWREKQAKFRKDFWLDFFYMFFNFFLFSLVIYNAGSEVFVNLFNDFLALFDVTNLVAIEIKSWNPFAHFALLFVTKDFIQWWVHRMLHRVPFLWEFHKVHHSVEQMGFAAHLRYHWMENVVYKSIQYIPMAMLGFNLVDFFIADTIALSIGHQNHANITVPGWIRGFFFGGFIGLGLSTIPAILDGVMNITGDSLALGVTVLALATGVVSAVLLGRYMKYILNSPEMHIWHHAYEMPDSHPHGINFGISFAFWDYIFGTAHQPYNGRDIKLGFPGMERFPKSFIGQNLHGIVNMEHDPEQPIDHSKSTG